jgi:multicomponent Na+:H+ antiporter subunit A
MPACSPFYEWAVLAIAVIGPARCARQQPPDGTVSLGIQGFGGALLFMLVGAPDLSFTQLAIETLSVVIRARYDAVETVPNRPSAGRARWTARRDCRGLGFGLLFSGDYCRSTRRSVVLFAHSRAIAHGRNIVNVIIVDFAASTRWAKSPSS